MCRMFAYAGEPAWLHDLLIKPEASLVHQSAAAREAKTVVNGDGCGLGWYGERGFPGVFRDTRPAWSDANLVSLCEQIKSPLFMAHVRSATAGEVARANCHPFVVGQHLFMHNGQVGGYQDIRRKIEALIPDELYPARCGTSDSEVLFLIAQGHALHRDPAAAFAKTLAECCRIMRASNIQSALRFSAVLSDGKDLYAFRWSSDDKMPSLYTLELETGIAISSEPFSFDSGPWREVPPCSVVHVARRKMTVTPFMPLP